MKRRLVILIFPASITPDYMDISNMEISEGKKKIARTAAAVVALLTVSCFSANVSAPSAQSEAGTPEMISYTEMADVEQFDAAVTAVSAPKAAAVYTTTTTAATTSVQTTTTAKTTTAKSVATTTTTTSAATTTTTKAQTTTTTTTAKTAATTTKKTTKAQTTATTAKPATTTTAKPVETTTVTESVPEAEEAEETEVLTETEAVVEIESANDELAKLSVPDMIDEAEYESEDTHPYNKQISTIIVNWKAVKGAEKYQLYVKGGDYKEWTKYKTVADTKCTVSGLNRATSYDFKVCAVADGIAGEFSEVQTIKTARFNFDKAGWEAMCRIVYHEVGQMSGSMWDEPIVYVSDCVVNRYAQAKYKEGSTWASYYKKYNSIQDVIYKSGGFMSDAALTRDGATYAKVTARVKTAVYGAVYGKAALNGIENDNGIYFWCNRSYKSNDKRIKYSYKIPWGYFNIWTSYWG